MIKSFSIALVIILMGFLLITAVIHKQPVQAKTKNTRLEYSQICKSKFIYRHSFSIKVRDKLSSILQKANSKVTDMGGRLEGNIDYGCFQNNSALGLIKGEYRSISDNEIEISIIKKPHSIPYTFIESKIKEQFI
jgi:hypothetical protein